MEGHPTFLRGIEQAPASLELPSFLHGLPPTATEELFRHRPRQAAKTEPKRAFKCAEKPGMPCQDTKLST